MQKKLPKLPLILLMGNAEKNTKKNIIDTKIGGIPYIPTGSVYPVDENGVDMICIAQLNLNQIFELVNKNNELFDMNYFNCFPKTGIIQIYLKYMEDLFDDATFIKYIDSFDYKNHDVALEKKISKHYKKYYKLHGSLTDFDKTIYISKAICTYSELNSTLQSHPQYEEFFGSENDSENSVDKSDNDDYGEYTHSFSLGGYPYHLQDDSQFNFDDKNEIILFNYVDSVLGLNISIKKNQLSKLNFENCGFDLAY